MKKIVIIAVAMAAIAANAATFSWKTTTTGKLYGADSTTVIASATAYLFDSSVVSQATLLSAFEAGTDISTLAKTDMTTVSSGAIAQKAFDVPAGYNEGDTFSGYFAVVVDDSIYISTTASASTPATGNKGMSFNEKATSQAAAFESTGGFQGAGWYTAVPEPTSGLLMLVGLAGLALRRRRA